MAYNGDPEKDMCTDFRNQKTLTLASFMNTLEDYESNCIRNNVDTTKVPVVIKVGRLYHGIPWFDLGLAIGTNGARIEIGCWNEPAMPVLEDKRPEQKYAEYWRSRGASNYDVSGFVNTKAAGERLLRMVKLVLEKDECETWLDYREAEPEWIQFKFSAKEFDVEKLSKLAKENDNIMTMYIMRECMLINIVDE